MKRQASITLRLDAFPVALVLLVVLAACGQRTPPQPSTPKNPSLAPLAPAPSPVKPDPSTRWRCTHPGLLAGSGAALAEWGGPGASREIAGQRFRLVHHRTGATDLVLADAAAAQAARAQLVPAVGATIVSEPCHPAKRDPEGGRACPFEPSHLVALRGPGVVVALSPSGTELLREPVDLDILGGAERTHCRPPGVAAPECELSLWLDRRYEGRDVVLTARVTNVTNQPITLVLRPDEGGHMARFNVGRGYDAYGDCDRAPGPRETQLVTLELPPVSAKELAEVRLPMDGDACRPALAPGNGTSVGFSVGFSLVTEGQQRETCGSPWAMIRAR